MNPSLLAANVLPDRLKRVGDLTRKVGAQFQLPLEFQDLTRLSGGHDFLLQTSNAMCAKTAFDTLAMPWIVSELDAQSVAALRASGASFTSAVLQQEVEGQVQASTAASYFLLQFSPRDILFDAPGQCRIRCGVTVAIGSLTIRPKIPQVVAVPSFGEIVEDVGQIIGDAAQALGAVLSGRTAQPLAIRDVSGPNFGGFSGSGGIAEAHALSQTGTIAQLNSGFTKLNRTIVLDFYHTFTVSSWLGGGVLEIPASYAAQGNQPSATIQVKAGLRQSTGHYTDLTFDAAILLADADPVSLVLETTQRIRRQGSLSLVGDVSLVGASATAFVSEIHTLTVDAFPCRLGDSPLNVGAVIVAGRVGSQAVPAFIGGLTYGVVWSADAVRLLVRYCWDTNAFPRNIPQTAEVQVTVDGVEQTADAISVFKLDTLDRVELEYDSNARRDVLYTNGSARVVPQVIRLRDGRELTTKEPGDPLFAPSPSQPWAALGSLTEEALTASSPDVLWFERMVTRGVTSRLGRPFTEPPDTAEVIDSSLSATAQRVGLLVQ